MSLLYRPASFSGILYRTIYVEAANGDDLEDKVSYTYTQFEGV